jgi:hypothetical protein
MIIKVSKKLNLYYKSTTIEFMKNIIFLLFPLLIFSCNKKTEIDPLLTNLELISKNQWKLERYTSVNGQTIFDSELDAQALFLFAMNFEFRKDGEVRGIDKASNNIIEKGVWKFLDENNSVNVKLTGLDYDFRIINLKTGKLTLQAPTGNYLSNLGSQINLEFTSVNL